MSPAAPKIEGISFREDWELDDFEKVPREYLMLNKTAVNARERTLKNKASISGVRVFPKHVKVGNKSRQ